MALLNRLVSPELKEAFSHVGDPEYQQKAMDAMNARLEEQKTFYTHHPEQSHHTSGPSPSFPPPKATQSGPVGASLAMSQRKGFMSMLGIPTQTNANAPKGDLSYSYPVATIYDFPTRYKITQPIGFVDMYVEDEYGNPILAFHGGSWFIKRKMSIWDLRTGQKVGKLEEELKSGQGKYKFKIFLDGKKEKAGSVTKLGMWEASSFASREFLIRDGQSEILCKTPVDGSALKVAKDDVTRASFMNSIIHNPAADGDTYYMEVSPGQDIRFMLSIVACFDKMCTAN